ncbi:MAG: hypothetical protein KDA74_20835, partial [Planctomycetaceae bacterium]|nr:hypothetical protein [Planctomycetaceae bacterium]
MSSALQIDSTCLRTLQNDASHKLTRRSIEALYTILEDNSENRAMLHKIGVPFLNSEETLIIPGGNATQISRFSNVPLYPLFANGELALNDPVHRQLLSTLIQSVLPKARNNGEYCAFIVPGNDSQSPLNKLTAQLISLQGFTPFATTITLAAGLSAFPAVTRFSGYVIYLGHSHSEMGLVHQSRVVARHSVPFGSEWMDEQLAHSWKMFKKDSEGKQLIDSKQAKEKRLSPQISLSPYLSHHSVVTSWYESLLDSLLDEFATQLEAIQTYIATLKRLPVVCLGDLAQTAGFNELLSQNLVNHKIPFNQSEVNLVPDEQTAITHGTLVVAAMEEEA